MLMMISKRHTCNIGNQNGFGMCQCENLPGGQVKTIPYNWPLSLQFTSKLITLIIHPDAELSILRGVNIAFYFIWKVIKDPDKLSDKLSPSSKI